MIFRVYIDESADQKQEKVAVVGAFLGKFGQWSEFQRKWTNRLRRDGLNYFRSTEYYSLRDEFAKFRDPIRFPRPLGSQTAQALRQDLDQIIKRVGLLGMAVAIPIAVYREVRKTEMMAREIFSEDPFESALLTLIRRCALTSKEDFRATKLSFYCDSGPSANRIAAAYEKFKAQSGDISDILQGLEHRDDKKFPALQAADLMANLAKEYYLAWLENPSEAHMRRLQGTVHRIDSWDRKYMLDVLQNEQNRRTI